MNVVAVIVGAGSGLRFGGDKVFADLAGKPLLAHSVATFERCQRVDGIVLVLRPDALILGRDLAAREGWQKVVSICAGGARRQDSVLAGVRAVEADWVLIHDAARPLVSVEIIERGLDAAVETGAAIAALPVRDTVKRVSSDGRILGTVDRTELWAAQTPQVSHASIIRHALLTAETVTDEASAIEHLGIPVRVFSGSERNFKVTTASDLSLAEAVLRCG